MSLRGCRSESVMMRGMVIDREEARLQTIAPVRAFLDGATEIAFRVPKAERFPFIERVLKRFGYAAQGRVGKGVLLRSLARLTRLSRQQVTRLVRQYRQDGTLSTGMVHLSTAFAAALPPRTGPCWLKWMRCIVPCLAQPPRS
jgi:hypothetical protein